MAFIREVKRGGRYYYYLVHTYRENGKVKQESQYLGTEKPKRPWAGLPWIPNYRHILKAQVERCEQLKPSTLTKAQHAMDALYKRLDELDLMPQENWDREPTRYFAVSFLFSLQFLEQRIAEFRAKWNLSEGALPST